MGIFLNIKNVLQDFITEANSTKMVYSCFEIEFPLWEYEEMETVEEKTQLLKLFSFEYEFTLQEKKILVISGILIVSIFLNPKQALAAWSSHDRATSFHAFSNPNGNPELDEVKKRPENLVNSIMIAGMIRDTFVLYDFVFNKTVPLVNFLPAHCAFQYCSERFATALFKLSVGSLSLGTKILENYYPQSKILKIGRVTGTSIYFSANMFQLLHASKINKTNFREFFNFANMFDCISDAYGGDALGYKEQEFLKERLRLYRKELLFEFFTPKFETPFPTGEE